MRHEVGGEPPASTHFVLDDYGITCVALESLRDQAGEEVVAAARGEPDDEADRTVRIGIVRVRHAGGSPGGAHQQPSEDVANPHRQSSHLMVRSLPERVTASVAASNQSEKPPL